jgi:uncharacterized protein
MSILIDLRSVIDEGVGASLSINSSIADDADSAREFAQFKLGDIDFCCVTPLSYELDFINAGECVQANGKVHADLSTACVRCLRSFDFHLDSELEESFFFKATEDEHGEPYPVIDDSLKVDIVPLLREALLVEVPFAPIHDSNCQGLCVKCGTDLNEADCGCGEEPDSSHPFADLKNLL